jgi:hypothetical protein
MIPAALRDRPRWIIWRTEQRDGKPTKVPYRPADPARRASVIEPDSWGSFEDATRSCTAGEGLGFVFTDDDDLLGVDLDGCYREDGKLHGAAAAVLLGLPSYAERSPSGRGLHVILRGRLNGQRHRTSTTPWRGGFEAYAGRRFFTVTGDHIEGTSETVENCQAELDQLLAELLPPPSPNGSAPPPRPPALEIDDEQLLARARAAKNGGDFDALYRGQHSYGSPSEADLALCSHLAFWTGGDAPRIDRLFRASGLMREKWDSRRGESTYGADTIAKALGSTRDFYEPPTGLGSSPAGGIARPPVADPGDWPMLSAHALPEFPLDALPPAVAGWASAVAEESQTPPDLAAMTALSVLSAAGMGTAVVDCGAWEEELALYVLVAMPSGDRKSTVLRAGLAPLRALERERRDEAGPEVRELRSRRAVLEKREKKLIEEIAKTSEADSRITLEAELTQTIEELARIGEPVPPRLLADDATAEALARLLAHHGSIAVIAAESALLDNLGGRYSDGVPNLHLICAAYSGEATVIDRKQHDPEEIERPLVTVGLAVQPHVLEALVSHRVARAQGLVARFAYALPETQLGARRINAPRAPRGIQDGWEAVVRRVFETPKTGDKSDRTPDSGTSVTSVTVLGGSRITLAHGARALLDALRAELEPRLAEDGDLRPVADWIARHAGRVARVAGLLHLAEHPLTAPIAEATMRDARRIGDYLLAHGLAALRGFDPLVFRALKWLARRGEHTVTQRDLQRGVTKDTAEDAAALAKTLEQLGALRALPSKSQAAGRPPSPTYEVNPGLLDGSAGS